MTHYVLITDRFVDKVIDQPYYLRIKMKTDISTDNIGDNKSV